VSGGRLSRAARSDITCDGAAALDRRPTGTNPPSSYREDAVTAASNESNGEHVSRPERSRSAALELLTVPEVMAALRLSRATVYDLIRSRQLRTVKIGRCRRIPPDELAAYLARLREDVA
jgi:excisionase family DNA binding protein